MMRLEHVSKTFTTPPRTVTVLDDVSLEINAGDFVAVLGASGAGKTTLLSILGCVDRPSAGRVWVGEREVTSLDDDALSTVRNETLGFVFQYFHLLPSLTALENVVLPFLYSHSYPADAEERALLILRDLGIGGLLRARANTLSGGQQQRVALARALVTRPRVILADEPTGSVDPETAGDIMALLERLNSQGQTIVLITHDPVVAAHAKRVVRIADGKVTSGGLPGRR